MTAPAVVVGIKGTGNTRAALRPGRAAARGRQGAGRPGRGQVGRRAVSLPEQPAAYIRVVGARNARDPHVRDQVRAVLTAAGERGWPAPEVYTEIGLPGWPRPGSVLTRLAGYLASGRHDAIIVANLSRISRDPAEVLAFAVQCDRYQVTLEAVDEGTVRCSAGFVPAGSGRPPAPSRPGAGRAGAGPRSPGP